MILYSLTTHNEPSLTETCSMSLAIKYCASTNEYHVERDSPPLVGWELRVGNMQCTAVQEIMSDVHEQGERIIKFRTRNTLYTWRAR
jgi:hypothetical protein